jgi:hypothetical protein
MKHERRYNDHDRPEVLTRNPVGIADEKRLEESDYVIDSSQDLSKAVSDGIILDWIDDSPFKRYVEGKLCIHFHFRICNTENLKDLGDYCVLLNSDIQRDNDSRVVGNQARMGDADTSYSAHGCGHGEELVLISRIQFLKNPERVKLRIRSIVRLQLNNLGASVRMDTAEPLKPPLFKAIGRQEDGPHNIPIRELATSQAPREVVEGASDVMNGITDDSGPANLRDGLKNFVQPEQVTTLFSVVFESDKIGLAVQKVLNFGIKRLEMFFSPTKLDPTFP